MYRHDGFPIFKPNGLNEHRQAWPAGAYCRATFDGTIIATERAVATRHSHNHYKTSTFVRRLAEMQGGTVETYSDGPGQGSEFVVHIPLVPHQGPFMPSPASSERSDHAVQSRRVLVIDDNVDAANSLSLLLRHLGHEVQTAHNGAGALELAGAFRPTIIFCDIGLPGMDGYEVARRLRTLAETKDAALIALTGYGQDRNRRDADTAGFHVHLLKPLSLEALQDVLTTIPAKNPPPSGSIGP